MNDNKRKVILDVDTGSDDAVLIMAAAQCKEVEVLGITVTHGNLPVEFCVENTLRVLELIGRTDIPVYSGCAKPMVKDLLPGRVANSKVHSISRVIDGKVVAIHDKYLPLPEAKIKPQQKDACSFLVETLRSTKEKITLLPVGPMSNIGMALRMDPSIAENIDEIICMGGGVNMSNDTLAAEANFFHDPEAAKIMLHCGAKVTVIPLDATHSASLGYDHTKKLREMGSPAAKFAADLIEHRIEATLKLGIVNKPTNALHDPLTLCTMLDPSVITDMRHANCDIDVSGGVADGQLLYDTRTETTPTEPTYIAFKGDSEKYFSLLSKLLG